MSRTEWVMDLLRAIEALASTLESEHTLSQSLLIVESALAHEFGAERVNVVFGIARSESSGEREVVAPLILDGRSIGIVTVFFTKAPSDRQRQCVRAFAAPLAALVAWRSRTSERDRLYEMVRTDALTGLANRMAFDERLDAAWQRAADCGATVSLALLDVDFFKLYNDRYGHVAGDECLRAVAAMLEKSASDSNAFVARYGGEEFALIFESSMHDVVVADVEKLSRAFESEPIAHAGSTIGRISISVGVASRKPAQGSSIAELVREADRSLYRAKALGRNRVCAGSYTSQGVVVTRQARAISGPPTFDDPTVGRDADLTRLLAALRQAPMVTLVGPSGIGKSRLACVAGTAAQDIVTDGVAYVDFSAFSDDGDPVALIGAAIDLEVDSTDIRRALCDALRERSMLLILDNVMESSARAVARLCDDLLEAASSLLLLVTSRSPIGAAGERTVVVTGIDEPAAVALLRLRTQSDDLPLLRAMARSLDGNPAALEVAARALAPYDLEATTGVA